MNETNKNPVVFYRRIADEREGIPEQDLFHRILITSERHCPDIKKDRVEIFFYHAPRIVYYAKPINDVKLIASQRKYLDKEAALSTRTIIQDLAELFKEEFFFSLEKPNWGRAQIFVRDAKIVSRSCSKDLSSSLYEIGKDYEGAVMEMVGLYAKERKLVRESPSENIPPTY